MTSIQETVTTADGRAVLLTGEETKVLRAVRRLSRLDFGRLRLFGASGWLSVRFESDGAQNDIFSFGGPISGGDGGDQF